MKMTASSIDDAALQTAGEKLYQDDLLISDDHPLLVLRHVNLNIHI